MSASELVVAFNFPPFADASAVTTAKRIVERAEPVDVLMADLSGHRRQDSSLVHLVDPFVEEKTVLAGIPIQFSSWGASRGFASACANRLAIGRRWYESVYSRSMWPHSHIAAAYLKLIQPTLHWRAEFSDPLLWTVNGLRRVSGSVPKDSISKGIMDGVSARARHLLRENDSVLGWAQMLPSILADEVIFTNNQQAELMTLDLDPDWRDELREKTVVAPHPILREEFYDYGNCGVSGSRHAIELRIGYFGTFYPTRGARDLLEAMAGLSASERSQIVLEVFTDSGTQLLEAARSLGLGRQVLVHAPVPYLDHLAISKTFDWLYVSDVHTSPFAFPSPFLPSKLSDYVGSGRPILASTLSGSPLDLTANLLKARVGDVSSLRLRLREILERRGPHRRMGSSGLVA